MTRLPGTCCRHLGGAHPTPPPAFTALRSAHRRPGCRRDPEQTAVQSWGPRLPDPRAASGASGQLIPGPATAAPLFTSPKHLCGCRVWWPGLQPPPALGAHVHTSTRPCWVRGAQRALHPQPRLELCLHARWVRGDQPFSQEVPKLQTSCFVGLPWDWPGRGRS